MCITSWNLGSAHIISLSTEVYFYLEFGLELLFKQYEWLKKDLEVNVNQSDMFFVSFVMNVLFSVSLLSPDVGGQQS